MHIASIGIDLGKTTFHLPATPSDPRLRPAGLHRQIIGARDGTCTGSHTISTAVNSFKYHI